METAYVELSDGAIDVLNVINSDFNVESLNDVLLDEKSLRLLGITDQEAVEEIYNVFYAMCPWASYYVFVEEGVLAFESETDLDTYISKF